MPCRGDGNESLRRLLVAAGWTYEALARAVNALGAENGVGLHYDRTAVAHWLAGSLPRRRTRGLLAEAFSRRLGRPVTIADLGMGSSAREETAVLTGAGTGAVARLAGLCALEADPVRRVVLEQAPFETARLEVGAWSGTAAEAAAGAPPPEAGRIREAVVFFRGDSDRGGRHGRSSLVSYLRDDVVPRLHARGRARVPPVLPATAAHLVHILAYMYRDDVIHGAAQLYFRAALQLAVEGGDPCAYGVVLSGMSCHAWDLGHRSSALSCAERAVRSVPVTAPDEVWARLLAQLAVARSGVGRRGPALETMQAAEQRHARVRDGDAGAGQTPFPPFFSASLEYQRGRMLAALGDRPGAIEALRRSVAHRSPWARVMRALTNVQIARLSLREGLLEEACVAWQRFVDDCLHLRSGRAERVLAGLRGELRAHEGNRCVQSLLRRVDALAGHGR